MKKLLPCLLILFFSLEAFSQVPELVKDIFPGGSGIDIYNPVMVEYNGRVYFGGKDTMNGTELWATDGTAQGTELIKDIWTGQGSSFPRNITVFNGAIYFSAYDVTHCE